MEQRASVGTTPQADEENHTLPTDSRIRRLASGHLEEALAADVRSEKEYHIRSALQALVIAERPVSTD
ncbi:hypothetical protein M0R88_04475 [Halorussus gelatinilyticus]|uniref:Uncharacterized protein n=1 Tax=Halorussus gelatinilyticus TaxID=2937524 RepID=A0A8U0IJX2_9EURY|nr:hypothetical protein [Halorussus gelatinilyticus]UPW01363.1 hypothetical protein M0R88_04475 [Halorussus gelatinilyticus]